MSAKAESFSWKTGEAGDYFFRDSSPTDGARLWTLHSHPMLEGPLTDSCVVAERDRKTAGFISAFIRPDAPETLFVWRIAVRPAERRRGLGRRLLHHLLSGPVGRPVRNLEAAVGRSNRASRALFEAVARDLDVPLQVGREVDSSLFPNGMPESEDLVRLGPLQPARFAGDEGHEPSHDQYAP